MSKPKLACNIKILRNGNDYELLVDGEQFPWLVDDVEVVIDSGTPRVRLTILAESVEVANTLDSRAEARRAHRELIERCLSHE